MIMMGPKKDKGGLVVAIMEKLNNKYSKGKDENEEYIEEETKFDKDDHGYKSSVDEMLEAVKSDNKEQFQKSLKDFILMCLEEKKEGEE